MIHPAMLRNKPSRNPAAPSPLPRPRSHPPSGPTTIIVTEKAIESPMA